VVGACRHLDLHVVVDHVRRVAEAVRHLQDLGNRVAKRSGGTPLPFEPLHSCWTSPAHVYDAFGNRIERLAWDGATTTDERFVQDGWATDRV